MGMLAVDTASLDRLAARLRSVSAEALALRRSPSLLLGVTSSLGSPVASSSVAGFVSAWGPALSLIGDDASRLADVVATASRLYADVEWANARAAS